MPEVSLLKPRQVLAKTGLSQSALQRLLAAGKFPAPLKLSSRAVGYRSDEVEAWIESRPRATFTPPPPRTADAATESPARAALNAARARYA
jgi:prophage regulatory protein